MKHTEDDMAVTVDGTAVKVGDTVCFKSDVEQCGTIAKITPSKWQRGKFEFTLTSKYGFSGEYIGGSTQTVVAAEDCWID
jgi:hypothetical protein